MTLTAGYSVHRSGTCALKVLNENFIALIPRDRRFEKYNKIVLKYHGNSLISSTHALKNLAG